MNVVATNEIDNSLLQIAENVILFGGILESTFSESLKKIERIDERIIPILNIFEARLYIITENISQYNYPKEELNSHSIIEEQEDIQEFLEEFGLPQTEMETEDPVLNYVFFHFATLRDYDFFENNLNLEYFRNFALKTKQLLDEDIQEMYICLEKMGSYLFIDSNIDTKDLEYLAPCLELFLYSDSRVTDFFFRDITNYTSIIEFSLAFKTNILRNITPLLNFFERSSIYKIINETIFLSEPITNFEVVDECIRKKIEFKSESKVLPIHGIPNKIQISRFFSEMRQKFKHVVIGCPVKFSVGITISSSMPVTYIGVTNKSLLLNSATNLNEYPVCVFCQVGCLRLVKGIDFFMREYEREVESTQDFFYKGNILWMIVYFNDKERCIISENNDRAVMSIEYKITESNN